MTHIAENAETTTPTETPDWHDQFYTVEIHCPDGRIAELMVSEAQVKFFRTEINDELSRVLWLAYLDRWATA